VVAAAVAAEVAAAPDDPAGRTIRGSGRSGEPTDPRRRLIEGAMGRRPPYREIEHTADVGIELEAPDLQGALERAAAAMFDLMSDVERVGESWRGAVRVSGTDLENLLVRWLTELLYLAESEGLLLSRVAVRKLDGLSLEAEVAGEKLDRARHAVRVEIKAPTYHLIRIENTGRGWSVRVVFDT